jgi:Ca2+/Na+ antiporter
MEEGFVRAMKRWHYFVAVGICLVATLFAVFMPALAIVMILVVLAVMGFFMYYYWKYELMKKERNPIRNKPKPTMMVEEVESEMSVMPDLDEMARLAAAGDPKVKANIVEGSGMDQVDRYFPLGEMLFPISFIANKDENKYQEGSLEIGEPVCLWHNVPVWFSQAPIMEGEQKYLVHCPKCPQGGKVHDKSLPDTKKTVELISTSTLRDGMMSMRDETLLEAIKRGRGELPG